MTLSVARNVLRRRTAPLARRSFASEAKLHKAKGNWEKFAAKRPIDHDDEHLVFHTPFNPITVIVIVVGGTLFGWGSMQYGLIHQQYKQGFWK